MPNDNTIINAPTIESEEWRSVKGWPYEVSMYGRVRRTGRSSGTRSGNVLKPYLRGKRKDYLCVGLWERNQAKCMFVHILVAAAFLGPKPDGTQVNHKDGIKTNNHASNLEYISAKENARHAIRLGLTSKGSGRSTSKLNEELVAQFKRSHQRGISMSHLARTHGVHRSTVRYAIKGKTWRHV